MASDSPRDHDAITSEEARLSMCFSCPKTVRPGAVALEDGGSGRRPLPPVSIDRTQGLAVMVAIDARNAASSFGNSATVELKLNISSRPSYTDANMMLWMS
jgi:hypothetical protein